MNPTATLTDRAVLTIRQSHLRAIEEQCPSMAWALAVEHREGPSFRGALRGTAIHEVFGRYTEHLFATGRETDFEATATITQEVLHDYPALSYTQRREVIDQARNIGEGFLFEREHYYGSEEALSTQVFLHSGRLVTITGRIDLLYANFDEGTATVWDLKSNHIVPADSAVQNDFQLMVYALLVLDNLPSITTVEGRLWLTRYNVRAPQKQPAVWTAEELMDFRQHLVLKLDAFLDAGPRQDHIPGNHCQYCPRRRVNECTLWRSYYGTSPPPPTSTTQARKLARQVVALEQAREDRIALLKAYVQECGPLRVGAHDKAETFAFWTTESEEIGASELLGLMESSAAEALFSQRGRPDLNELLTVNRRGKAFRQLRKSRELGEEIVELSERRVSTTFRHKGGEPDE